MPTSARPAVRNDDRDAPAPEQRGQTLVAIPRGEAEELRVSLDSFEGHPFVSVRVWAQGRDGAWWPVRGKGCSVRVRELGQVIGALEGAAKQLGQGRRPKGSAKGLKNVETLPSDPRPELPGLADAQDLAPDSDPLDVF